MESFKGFKNYYLLFYTILYVSCIYTVYRNLGVKGNIYSSKYAFSKAFKIVFTEITFFVLILLVYIIFNKLVITE